LPNSYTHGMYGRFGISILWGLGMYIVINALPIKEGHRYPAHYGQGHIILLAQYGQGHSY